MLQRIMWDHLDAAGSEYVTINGRPDGMEVNGTVLLISDNSPHRVSYVLRLGPDWKTKKLKVFINEEKDPFIIETVKEDKWWVDGRYVEALDGASNIDLSLTPLTNSLPINRVSWMIGEKRTFKMVSVQPLSREVMPILQTYTYLGDSDGCRIFQYRCRNFETALVVDQNGWVVEYPGFFYRQGHSDYTGVFNGSPVFLASEGKSGGKLPT
ncbi:hypothetical protein GLW03_03185 [Halobacillus halophilus]|uniref:putative glycolipid-binding domain-containing protein n=1 Tax=Halobacillus halophilus TaxID=1570 RepID=UPI00136B55BD|nr:putative glycolipid-binding domain-containing protein [Halobacillus halophilus]MYL28816.1 hypothetical protein [Halobacillus halophilus]